MAYYATSDEQSKEEKRALYTDTGIQAQDRLCGESLANLLAEARTRSQCQLCRLNPLAFQV
jgi:hypothetical protein